MLKANGIECYVVDPASIATSRRRRRAKTEKLDGAALVRALLAFKRGEPRVCAMVKAQIKREVDRLELLLEQLAAVENERGTLLAAQKNVATETPAPTAMLLDIKGIGPEFAAIL